MILYTTFEDYYPALRCSLRNIDFREEFPLYAELIRKYGRVIDLLTIENILSMHPSTAQQGLEGLFAMIVTQRTRYSDPCYDEWIRDTLKAVLELFQEYGASIDTDEVLQIIMGDPTQMIMKKKYEWMEDVIRLKVRAQLMAHLHRVWKVDIPCVISEATMIPKEVQERVECETEDEERVTVYWQLFHSYMQRWM